MKYITYFVETKVLFKICLITQVLLKQQEWGSSSINWQRCVICQVFSSEQLSSSTSKGPFTLISVIVKRKEEVYRRLVDEFKTIENVHIELKFNIIEVVTSLLQVSTICQPLYFLLMLKVFPNPL